MTMRATISQLEERGIWDFFYSYFRYYLIVLWHTWKKFTFGWCETIFLQSVFRLCHQIERHLKPILVFRLSVFDVIDNQPYSDYTDLDFYDMLKFKSWYEKNNISYISDYGQRYSEYTGMGSIWAGRGFLKM